MGNFSWVHYHICMQRRKKGKGKVNAQSLLFLDTFMCCLMTSYSSVETGDVFLSLAQWRDMNKESAIFSARWRRFCPREAALQYDSDQNSIRSQWDSTMSISWVRGLNMLPKITQKKCGTQGLNLSHLNVTSAPLALNLRSTGFFFTLYKDQTNQSH